MVTYIYFVKCPNCEDEHFDFFDEAKEFALGCISKKPVITQVEVNRNDFGECTDSADLGTVWSWEDMMKDVEVEPADTVFSKAETFGISEGLDDFDDFDIGPQVDEFSSFEDDLAQVEDNNLWVAENLDGGDIVAACWAASEGDAHNLLAAAFRERTGGDLSDCYIYPAEAHDYEYIRNNPELLAESRERKPIPDGMTIEQLVEEMEENEDEVECTWCNDLFDKSECRREVNLGWLCSRCEAAIKSRGEPLTFRENDYWDFLDEEVDELKEAFKYLPLVPDAKNKIIDELKNLPEISRYVSGDAIAVDLFTKSTSASGYSRTGKVTNFIIADDTIEICFERNGQVRYVELEDALSGNDVWFGKPVRAMPTYKVLSAIKTIATKLNKDNKDVAGIRDYAAAVNLTPEIAEELKAHIRDIHFKIPRHGNYGGDEFLDADPHPKDKYLASITDPKALDKAADKVAEHLNNIHASFMSLRFARDAITAGMVSYRDPINDANQLVDTFLGYKTWGIACTIYFKKGWTLDNFSNETKKYLEGMKIASKNTKTNKDELEDHSDIDDTKKSKSKDEPKLADSVSGIRTAKALIRYFNNNVRFFESSIVTEASLNDILSNANDEYGTDYNERDFLDAGGFEDVDAFADLETQNEITAQAHHNQRRRQAYAINKAKESKLEELHDLGNEYDGAYPNKKPELPETDEVSDFQLTICPECGEEAFDAETGICIACGFN